MMLLRSSSSPLLNSLNTGPVKDGNESELNAAIRRCKSVQGISLPVFQQLHVAEDFSGNWFRRGEPSAAGSPESRRSQSDGNLHLQQRNPGRQWRRRRSHGSYGEISFEEVLRNGRLDESLEEGKEEETEDWGSEIRVDCVGRDPLGNELQSGGVAVACRKAPAVAGRYGSDQEELSSMYIAGGLGSGDGSGPPGGGGGYGGRGGSSGSDSNSTDAYYQKMLEANPGHPLLLRNYARFLHEVLRDYSKAEEYYGRAILASPGDGDVLSLYAKLIWDVHRDAGRAEAYFDQAVQAAPDDCYVLGSYAHFLWNAEDDGEGDEDDAPLQHNVIPPAFYGTTTATAA